MYITPSSLHYTSDYDSACVLACTSQMHGGWYIQLCSQTPLISSRNCESVQKSLLFMVHLFQTILDSKAFFLNRALAREIDMLHAVCQCRWTGSIKEFTKHEKSCTEVSVLCSQCLAPIKISEMRQHKGSKYDSCQPMVKCKYGCRGLFRHGGELEEHSCRHLSIHLDSVHETVNTLYAKYETLTEGRIGLHAEASTEAALTNTTMKEEWEIILEKVNQLESKIREVHTQSLKAKAENVEIMGIDKKVVILSDVVTVLHKEIFNSTNKLNTQMVKDRETVTSLQEKVTQLECSNLRANLVIRDLENRIKIVECGSMDGSLIWKITDVGAKTRQAKDSVITSMYSPNFTTSKYGYKMCARLYFNGDGMGKGTHVSLFLTLLRGDYDALLQWPFRQKVTLTLIDQVGGQHHQKAFRPDMVTCSFARPLTAMNVASGCPKFITQSALEQNGNPYVVNDTLFIKIEVATPLAPLYR
jgi:hypothetical protein